MDSVHTDHIRPITPRVHGMMDYAWGLLLVLAPWMFAFSAESTPTSCAVAIGVLSLVWSTVTDYPAGLARFLPFRVHLWLDAIVGGALIIAPWLLPISEKARLVLVIFGIVAVAVSFLTRRPSSQPCL